MMEVKEHIRYSLTEHTCSIHGLDMIRFSFCMHASMRVHARLMTSNLPCKTLVYTLDMCTTVSRCTLACQECTCQI